MSTSYCKFNYIITYIINDDTLYIDVFHVLASMANITLKINLCSISVRVWLLVQYCMTVTVCHELSVIVVSLRTLQQTNHYGIGLFCRRNIYLITHHMTVIIIVWTVALLVDFCGQLLLNTNSNSCVFFFCFLGECTSHRCRTEHNSIRGQRVRVDYG